MRLRIIQILSPLIMLAAAVTSFRAQHDIFLSWEVDGITAVVVPLSIDMLALLCSLAIPVPSLPVKTRVTAVLVLIVTGGGSVVANWMSGTTAGAKAVHAAAVVLYLLAETVASQVSDVLAKDKSVVTRVRDEESEAEREPEMAATASTKRAAYGPRDPQRGYSDRHQRRLAGAKA